MFLTPPFCTFYSTIWYRLSHTRYAVDINRTVSIIININITNNLNIFINSTQLSSAQFNVRRNGESVFLRVFLISYSVFRIPCIVVLKYYSHITYKCISWSWSRIAPSSLFCLWQIIWNFLHARRYDNIYITFMPRVWHKPERALDHVDLMQELFHTFFYSIHLRNLSRNLSYACVISVLISQNEFSISSIKWLVRCVSAFENVEYVLDDASIVK